MSIRRFRAGRRAGAFGVATALAAVVGLLAGCGGDSAGTADAQQEVTVASGGSTGDLHGFGSRAKARTMEFIGYIDRGESALWDQAYNGAEDAAAVAGLNLTTNTAGADAATMTSLIRKAIENRPAALLTSFNEPDWESAACDAQAAGIAVFAMNVPPSSKARPCIEAFVGQNFTTVGEIIGQRLLAEVAFEKGDTVLCPAEEPDQQYAIQRGGGVNVALKAVGLKCTYLRTSGDADEAQSTLTAWLKKNPDVAAVVPLGGTPHSTVIAAEDAANVTAPVIGFDVSEPVIAGIKSGRIIAAADQQGYVQGFQSVLQAGLFLDFGLSPADVNSGGNGLIDKSNVANLEAADLEGVRW